MGTAGVTFSGMPRCPGTAKLRVFACVIACLGLAACGRKGGLDAPPGPSIAQPLPAQSAAPEIGPDGQPVQVAQPTPPPPQGTLLDWLID
jgi:predicted small lipoprotein YifL